MRNNQELEEYQKRQAAVHITDMRVLLSDTTHQPSDRPDCKDGGRVVCPGCNKVFSLSIQPYCGDQSVSVPCPACGAEIIYDPQYLQKQKRRKTDHEDLEETLTTNASQDKGLKKTILRTIRELPPMPEAIHKARKVIADPGSNFKDLAIVLVADQAIATKVLRMANSAYYGLPKKVSSIQHASVVLGHKKLAELVTMAASATLMDKKLKGYGFEAGELWRHSIAVAFGSRFVAKKKNPFLTDDAFAAGLIHDAGKLVLDRYVLENKEAFYHFTTGDTKALVEAERHVLGCDHSEIAFDLCNMWNIPDNLAIGIQYHHAPNDPESNILALVLYVADLLARMADLGRSPDDASQNIDSEVLAVLGLNQNDLERITEQMGVSVEKTLAEFA